MVLTAIPQKSNLSKLTLDDVKRGLPASLLTTLERRWYDEFRLNQVSIAAHKGGDLRAETRFLQIYEIAHNENLRQSLHLYNMQNVISSLRDGSHSLAYAVCSDGQQLNLLLGVRDYGAATQFQTKDYVDVLYRALRSNYPGIVLAEKTSATESEALSAPYRIVPYQDYQSRLIQPIKSNQYLASITGIPSLRDPNAPGEFFSQSIDRLVDALRGETYVLLILAEPIPDARLIGCIW